MTIEIALVQALNVAALLMFIFDTNVVYQYLKLFGIVEKYRVFKLYQQYLSDYGTKNFFLYLGDTYPDSFVAKLFSCPYCLGFWLSVLFCITTPSHILLVAFLSLFSYNLLHAVRR